jgi:hypothetical protein
MVGGRVNSGQPRAASAVSVFAGAWIAFFGIVWLGIIIYLYPGNPSLASPFAVLSGVIETGLGMGVVLLGRDLTSHPTRHRITGGLVMLLGALSLGFGFVGGLLLGFIMALIGGVLAIGWKPTVVILPTMEPPTAAPLSGPDRPLP